MKADPGQALGLEVTWLASLLPTQNLAELLLSLGSRVTKVYGCRWRCVLLFPLLSASFVDLTSNACPGVLVCHVSI